MRRNLILVKGSKSSKKFQVMVINFKVIIHKEDDLLIQINDSEFLIIFKIFDKN